MQAVPAPSTPEVSWSQRSCSTRSTRRRAPRP